MEQESKWLKEISSSPPTPEELRFVLSCIDLTSLDGTDNETTIAALCEKGKLYETAAVCVYPNLVSTAKKQLKGTGIRIASVAGAFPSGQSPLPLRLKEAEFALEEGADEIDMVISRGKFLQGDFRFTEKEISSFKKLCRTRTLKVILETGELQTSQNIRKASEIAIGAGADFIKTSTGKINVGAAPESVCCMLFAIKESGEKIGIKPSGGISEPDAAIKYLRLTEKILGPEWMTPALFRIGASRLADRIYSELRDKP